MAKRPLVLCILDGLGYARASEFNAVKKAKAPTLDNLGKTYPHSLLHAAGLHVGLPEGQMGNSEVGHTAIGLGRIVFQDLPKISMAIKNNTLKDIEELKNLIDVLKKTGKNVIFGGFYLMVVYIRIKIIYTAL